MAAKTTWDGLHHTLDRHCGQITRQQSIVRSDWLTFPTGEDVFHVATSSGQAYLLDPAMVLTSNLDLAATISAELACLVVAFGAETVSGTYWFLAAESGNIRRAHWNVRATLTQPFDVGGPLKSEARVPLEDMDGKGLLACLAELGFNPDVVTGPTDAGERYAWTGSTLPEKGPIAREIDAHHGRYARAEHVDWTKRIKVVPRADGSFDMQYQPPEKGKSLLGKLFRR